MNHSVITSQGKGFIAGLTTATLTFLIYHQWSNLSSRRLSTKFNVQNPRSRRDTTTKQRNNDLNETNHQKEDVVMDSPDLPLRMIRKAETAILRRTSRIIVVVERCTNEHNYSAILRTVEALGIQHVWLISPTTPFNDDSDNDDNYTQTAPSKNGIQSLQKVQSKTGKILSLTAAEMETRVNHHIFAQKAAEWLTIREFDSTSECLKALKKDDREIWATDLSQEAVCLTREGLTRENQNPIPTNNTDSPNSLIPKRLAIVFGTEAVGCSTEMLTSAHKRVYLPLHGFADSLNLSVATALCLLQLFHLDYPLNSLVGSMSGEERMELRKQWYPKLATQRILTSGQKKLRGKLVGKVKKLEEIERKRKLNKGELTKEQLEKLKSFQKYKEELRIMDENVHSKAVQSVQKWLDDPPPPLSDMRRADEHRICYVGKNTKNRNNDFWKEMPAVINVPTHERKGISATYFRDLVNVD